MKNIIFTAKNYTGKVRSGFTLAEVLITLSIIGVIAAMVIPSLVQDTQDAQYKASWKHSYSTIGQAYKMVLMESAGSFSKVCANDDSLCLRNKFRKYLNYTKSCDNASTEGCWHADKKWKNLDNKYLRSALSNPALVLNDGNMVTFNHISSTCSDSDKGVETCGDIWVDVNGFKGPNMIGKDIYFIYTANKTILPAGVKDDFYGGTCSNTKSGFSCAAEYLYK